MHPRVSIVACLVAVNSASVAGFVGPALRDTSSSVSSFATSRRALPSLQRVKRPFDTTTSALFATAAINNQDYDEICDVLVLGSGPAARAIASLLASSNKGILDVVLADKNIDREWPPNYGVWQDEWKVILDRYKAAGVEMGGGNCGDAVDRGWDVTDCFFGGSFDIPMEDRTRVDRPYYRVDKNALQQSLTSSSYRLLRANHFSTAVGVNVYEPAESLVHDATGTTIKLKTAKDDVLTVRSKLVVDCTGHETKLVLRETRGSYRPPGFQIAYGALVEVDESNSLDLARIGPYDKKAMTLFDYRTDHFDSADNVKMRKVESAPTFMYAMPLGGNRIFFEETSLVARPAVSFQECKDRCFERLEYHGIKVAKVEEEEFCYIPMGGALPAKDQRILALGGAAAMVHPSTGYHICRCLMGAADMAAVIKQELTKQEPNLDRAAASGYHSLWTPENIRQRNFAVFGGEFLMKQNVVGLRGFFDGFFRLPLKLWGGFLAGWPGLPYNKNHESWFARMWFGLNFIVRIPAPVAVDMLGNIVGYIFSEGLPLAQSVTPFLGEPESYELEPNKDGVGDVAAKMEARRMIQQSILGQDLPVDFGSDGQSTTSIASAQETSSAPLPTVTGTGIAKVDEEPTAEVGSFQ